MRLLICGVPGSGKTTFGDWLRDHHGYKHYDFESKIENITTNPDTVVTWGFVPDDIESQKIILLLIKMGFKPIWFSDKPFFHIFSYSRYIKRNKQHRPYVANWLYFRQINKIDENRTWIMFNKTINPFHRNGKFKKSEDLLKQMI